MIGASLYVIAALIAVALIFDFLNGLHDAANSIATVVSTRVLSPSIAVIWAAFFNFIAFLFFGLHVAQDHRHRPDRAGDRRLAGDLRRAMGAITWNLFTWWGGIPSSSSHALLGGLVGAGPAEGGLGAVVWPGIIQDIRRHRVVAGARLRARASSVARGCLAVQAEHVPSPWTGSSA